MSVAWTPVSGAAWHVCQEPLLLLHVGGCSAEPRRERSAPPGSQHSRPGLFPLEGPVRPDGDTSYRNVLDGSSKSVCPEGITSPTEIAAKYLMGTSPSTQSPVGALGAQCLCPPFITHSGALLEGGALRYKFR